MKNYEKLRKVSSWRNIIVGVLVVIIVSSLALTGCSSTDSASNSTDKTTVSKSELENEFKILNEKERRVIYDKYNFNLNSDTHAVDVLKTYDIDTDETSQLDGSFYFDLPSDPNGKVYEYGETSYEFVFSENTGYIDVTLGKPVHVRPLKNDVEKYEEWVEVKNFETKELTGYIEFDKAWPASYFIYVQSKNVKNSEPAMICQIFADSYVERNSDTSSKLKELSDAILSQILESCIKQVN